MKTTRGTYFIRASEDELETRNRMWRKIKSFQISNH